MILTSNAMEWLNQNRRRSYPLQREIWRSLSFAAVESPLDCLLLDASVFDADANGSEELILVSASVSGEKTTVVLRYGETTFSIELTGGTVSGESSFEIVRGVVHGSGLVGASISLAFSSHAYILETVGTGNWTMNCPVLRSRVIRLSDGTGVLHMTTGGSSGVSGHESSANADGEVILEDGYRTSPIVYAGKVFVRIGKRYGYDPCTYDFGDAGDRDCRRPLFFFCGQNGVNSGNIVLRGGRGISVTQGRSYKIDDKNSKCNGKSIPCIEIVAGRELLDICKITD